MHENRRYGKLAKKSSRPSGPPRRYPQPLSPSARKGRGNVDNLLCAKCSISRALRPLRTVAEGVGSPLHRARSASRSKPLLWASRRKPKVHGRGGRKRHRLGEFWSHLFSSKQHEPLVCAALTEVSANCARRRCSALARRAPAPEVPSCTEHGARVGRS